VSAVGLRSCLWCDRKYPPKDSSVVMYGTVISQAGKKKLPENSAEWLIICFCIFIVNRMCICVCRDSLRHWGIL